MFPTPIPFNIDLQVAIEMLSLTRSARSAISKIRTIVVPSKHLSCYMDSFEEQNNG